MVKVTIMAPCRSLLCLAVLVTVAVVNVSSEFFFQPIKPLYFVQKPQGLQLRRGPGSNFPNSENVDPNRAPPSQPQINRGRSDLVGSSEEEQGDDGNSGEYEDGKNFTKLPQNFDENVRRNRPPLEPRRHGPLYGDPAAMEDDTEEQDRSRFLWPFSTTVTVQKTKNIPRPHHHHLSYHDYVEQMYNQAHGGGGHGQGWDDDDVPPLTDEEILHSKGIFSARQLNEAQQNPEAYDAKSTVTDTVTSWGSALLPTRIFQRIRSSLPFGSSSKQGNKNSHAQLAPVGGQEKSELEFDDDEGGQKPELQQKPVKPKRPSSSFFQLPQLFRFRRPQLRMPGLDNSKPEPSNPPPSAAPKNEDEASGNQNEDDDDGEEDDDEEDEEEDDAQDQDQAGSETGNADEDDEESGTDGEGQEDNEEDGVTQDGKAEIGDDHGGPFGGNRPNRPHQFRHGNPTKNEQTPAAAELIPTGEDKTTKVQKKQKFKEKIYSILYNTMDILDKSFAEPEEEDEVPS